ncbi:MAG: TrkH family potassium uptake protein [Candidatus Thiodiazotropha sp.]
MIGRLLLVFSLTMIPPFLVGLYYGDGATIPFVHTFFLTLFLGLLCWVPTRECQFELPKRLAILVVVGFWVLASLLCAIPFMLAVHPHMHFTDAVFEATSGLTTTGATVLQDLDWLPHAILYYRAQLNFLGGMGIVVLAIAVLPMFGVGGMQLYRAETPGPMKDEKLTPRIRETAKRLWFVYVGLVIACALSYWAAGMSLFDAISHSFATLALGGFSTHSESIGYFHSPAIEIVGGIFSLLAGINFALHFLAWKHRSLMPMFRNAEFRVYLWVITVVIVTTCFGLWVTATYDPWESFYHGFFQAASIVTDNGLTAGGYPNWPPFIPLLLMAASFFGGCVGSTCGGIKAFRFLLLMRQSLRELRLLMHPAAQIVIRIGGTAVEGRVVEAVWGFFFLYISSYVLLSLAVSMTGTDIESAFGSVAACINNMGVGFGITASSFADLGIPAKWMLVLAMLMGRLEVFPLLLVLTWRHWE